MKNKHFRSTVRSSQTRHAGMSSEAIIERRAHFSWFHLISARLDHTEPGDVQVATAEKENNYALPLQCISILFYVHVNSRNECKSFTEMIHSNSYGFVQSPNPNSHIISHSDYSTHPQKENVYAVLLLRLCQPGNRWTDNKKGKYTPD